MKNHLLTAIIFFTFCFSNAYSQEFKLGKVSVAELQEKEHPKDPAAPAAILFKKGTVRFLYTDNVGFEMVTDVEIRIKIYKKEGYEWANKGVRYYIETQSAENLTYSDAVTYNLVDGKIEKTKLKSDGEFVEKINKYWGRKKIAMPNIKEGCVIEYKYTIRSPRIGSMRDWDFQYSIPVNFSELVTYVPEYYVFKPSQKGFVFPKVTVIKKRNAITLNSKERTGGWGSATKTEFYQDKIDYEETQTTYTARDLPAMKEENFVNNIDNYTSSVSHELSTVSYPNTPIKYYSTDWESVAKTIYDYDEFGSELNKTGYFENDITKLLTGINAPNERINAIFNYVKSTVKWDNTMGFYCHDGVKTAYKNKTGNTAEINLMLTAMLRFAGLDANPVLVSTRDNGISFFPSRNAFNSVIAAVETPEGPILLDASEKYAVPNVLPIRDLNWYGRLIRTGGTSVEVDLMPKNSSNGTHNIMAEISNEGAVSGKIRTQYTNHKALEFRDDHVAETRDTYLEKLERKNQDIEISDYVRDNDLDLTKPIIENYTFKDSKQVEIIGGKMYIAPLLFLTQKENPFKQEVRQYPVDFGYPKLDKYGISIKIPEGYEVESLPAAMNIATGENVAAFKYMIANSGNTIQIIITREINSPIVQADFYPVLKDFYQKMTDKVNEKIVFKKL